MQTARCPICGKQFSPQASGARPFCSDRCRQIDLGRWLKEDYSVPVMRPRDEDEGPAASEDDGRTAE